MKKGGRTYNHGGTIKNKVQHFWDLTSPKMCRDFLKNAHAKNEQGQTVDFTSIVDENGKTYSIDEAPDEAVIDVANQIAQALGKRK